MNANLNLNRIGKCLDAYDLHEGNAGMQHAFSIAMMREVYPEVQSFDDATRRFFGVHGKTHKDVYGYFRKLYDDAKNPSAEASALANNPDGVSAEKSNDIIRSNSWLGFQRFAKRVSPEIRESAFSIIYAEDGRTGIAETWAEKLLSMSEEDREAVLWGAYILNPEKAAGFFERVGTRVLENLGDNAFNFESYWEGSQKGVNPNTVYDAVVQLGAIGQNGRIIPEKLPELNKKLNQMRGEASMFSGEFLKVSNEKLLNAVRSNRWGTDWKEYGADFIEKEYAKGKRYKEAFRLVSQIRNIKRSNFAKQGVVMQTIEDATVVGVEMLKYGGASALGTAISKNPITSIALVSAVMYSEFKPQMFNALRHEGNMSVNDANKYANFSTAAMVAANYVGYTTWIKAVKPSSYLLGTDISAATAREYFFHAVKEIPKSFVRRGGTETVSEYMESVAELATKLWAADHAGADFDEKRLWENFRQDFIDTSRIMPALMFGSSLFGGGLAVNKVRRDSGAGWNMKKLIFPSEAVNHNVQAHAAYAQAEAAAREAAQKLGGTDESIDFVRRYANAKTEEEKLKLFYDAYPSEEERENARAVLENLDKLDGEVQKAFAKVLADAAEKNARETEELDRRAQELGVFNEAQEDSDGAKKFAVVENLLDKLDARNEVVMINAPADLERLGFSPERAQEIFSQAGRKGLYSAEDDKVYMLLSHFKNGVDAFRTFVHERGHWVAAKLKNNPEYRRMLSTVVELAGGEETLRSLLPASYAGENADGLAEEYIMRVVERVAMEEVLNARQKGVWNFFKAKFKKWFGSDNTFASIADRQIAEIARDIYRRAVEPQANAGNYWESSTPENNARKVSGQWQILDASELITSTDKGYDDTLQPRNRTRMGSAIQTSEIAAHLEPARLDNDTTTDKGAPIIDSRKMVVSGNGRTLAIREAYDSENKERARVYREFVLRRAEELGIDVDPNVKNPVLVRRIDNLGSMTLADFAARSNKSQIAAMSNAENAIADARRILDAHLLDIFFPSESGDVLAASNNDFISRFIDIIGNREEYIDKHGNRKPNLAPRIKAAVLAATLNPEKRDIIEDLLDNPQGWNGLINGLLGSVANLAKLEGNADYGLSEELSEAVETYVQLRRNGETVAEFNAQEDFLRPQISEEVGFLIELFEKNSRTPTGISGVLNEYYNLVKNIDTTTQDLFGAENPPKIERLRAAYKNHATDLAQSREPAAQWRDTSEPTAEEIREARRQYNEVVAKYKGTPLWLKAPNGKPTNLTERQWVQVRTPNFKKWFGDWETLAIINEIKNMPAKAVKFHEALDKAGIKETFKSFGEVQNKRDGRIVVFPMASAGKILRHKGFPTNTIIRSLKTLFEDSIRILSETESKKDGHREHGNIVFYEHYLNKFSFDGIEYFIRFTVPIAKNEIKNNIHSTAVSNVYIYKKGGIPYFVSAYNNAESDVSISGSSGNSAFIDGKLAKFLNSVKPENVSKVVDENGEPLVVYHGARKGGFTAFMEGINRGKKGFFFSDSKTVAKGYSPSRSSNPFESIEGGIYNAYLRLVNPKVLDADGTMWYQLSENGSTNSEELVDEAMAEGYDGLIIKNVYDNGRYGRMAMSDVHVAFDSLQIKSASKNLGTFKRGEKDIRWREIETRSREKLDALDEKHRGLYERYKGGDQTAYGEALKLVSEEARRKGYETKAYHGTGADGFNVADASSKYEENGEGAQAHGPGLYMAADRDTAESYRRGGSAKASHFELNDIAIKGKNLEAFAESSNVDWGDALDVLDLYARFYRNGYARNGDFESISREVLEYYDEEIANKEKMLSEDKFSSNHARTTTREYLYELKRLRKAAVKIRDKLSNEKSFKYVESNGRVFDWFHNMKPDELLDEQLSFSKQNAEVKKKLRKLFKDNGKDLAELMKTGYVRGNPTGGQIYGEVQSVLAHGSEAEASRLLSKYGIKGITYDGRQDGRAFVSFEGGPAVKLQDAFTFDGYGKLIPLSERFNESTPDMRWRIEDSETKRAADEWAGNPENAGKLAEEYLSEQRGQIVVDPDKIRARLPNYEISLNSDFVEAGDKVLEVVWAEALKLTPKDKPVVLLTGNPAAGKGTAIKNGLLDEVSDANLVFDAPQNKFTSVEKRVKEAVDAGHRVRIVQIYNDPITSWKNSLERGIGKDNPETGKRDGGRFLPMKYFVRVYESAQGKVEKIETILRQKYKSKLITKYIDNTGNTPIIATPDEAKAWDYSISEIQLIEIERITDEYRGRIEESARLRGDKKDPFAVIGRGISQVVIGMDPIRGSAERISGRSESDSKGTEQSLSGKGGEGRGPVSRLKFLLRQERRENPVIWASIVLAKEMLLGRSVTAAKMEMALPSNLFDGAKRQYALDRAKRIADKTRLTQKDFVNDLDRSVQKAESDLFWQEEFVENAMRAFSKGGEEYGFAKQKLLQYLKNMRDKKLAAVKGYETDDFDFNLVESILKAQEEEPKRAKPGEPAAEETEETESSGSEFGADEEVSGKKMPLTPSPIREVVAKIRTEVAKRVRNANGDARTLNEKYRKTLVNILADAAKELTYGREREAIMKKIGELSRKSYAAVKIKEGERAGQTIDNYTLRAEHIALRIFNRGVRDTNAQLLERFDGIIRRKGKKPSRMERDDKRKLAGAVQMRIYKIGKFAEMDEAELEAEYSAAVEKLENASAFAGEPESGGTKKDFSDIEDVRAEAANAIADIRRFGNLRQKSRADMAEAVEFLEKHIEEETRKQKELVAKRKEEAAQKRKVISDALKMSTRNAHKDGALRSGGRALINKTMPFDSFLAMLGEYATGETFKSFDAWRKDLVARIDRAAALAANETFKAQETLVRIAEECYSESFPDALKRLLRPDAKFEEFSNMGGGEKRPMSLANVLQLYASALQENYAQNVYAHRAKKNPDVEKLQNRIDEIRLAFPDRESRKGDDWKRAKEEIKSLESRIFRLQKDSVAGYIERLERVLTDADKKFVQLLRKEYADALPALSEVSRRVIGLPIEQADALYMPVKIKMEKTFAEAAEQVPVVPKTLSPRVRHMRDFDETADPISLYLDRVRENAQFKYFSELYIEMRSIFGNEELQDLISQKCGENTLRELLDFIVDISSGKTRGYKDEYIQKANGLFAIVALGFNLGSGARQFLPGCFSWGTYIGTPAVFKNMASFFTPEGFKAALEIWRSDNGRRRFSIGNLQIMEEMLAAPDQNKFWAAFKRHALVFNRASDMLAISFVGQGVYRTGVENYIRQGFSEAKAKEKAMADMWQIAERTQASGRMHNMARWQRRGGDLGKGIGMFSAPPQLMFSKSAQDIRRAIALGIKTPEGRAAARQAFKTWAIVSILVEGSYAASGVLWNALLKGFFDDDDDERIIRQMATGPFGGLFLFGRMIENSARKGGIESIMPVAGLARPAGNAYELMLDLIAFDLDKALEDLNKLGKSTLPLYRDFRKVLDNRILGEN